MRIEWTPGAVEDLSEIVAYGNDYSPGSGTRRVRKIQASVNLLAANPNIGRVSRLPGVRELIVPGTPHIVVTEFARHTWRSWAFATVTQSSPREAPGIPDID